MLPRHCTAELHAHAAGIWTPWPKTSECTLWTCSATACQVSCVAGHTAATALARQPDPALDAGRPHFNAKSRKEAEDFFLVALSKWREAMGIDKVSPRVLPACQHQLLLTSPSADGACRPLPGRLSGRHLRAAAPGAHQAPGAHLPGRHQREAAGLAAARVDAQPLVALHNVPHLPVRSLCRCWQPTPRFKANAELVCRGLFQLGATPGGFIRFLGPYGSGMVHGYARNRQVLADAAPA